jgi:hypothetical protein
MDQFKLGEYMFCSWSCTTRYLVVIFVDDDNKFIPRIRSRVLVRLDILLVAVARVGNPYVDMLERMLLEHMHNDHSRSEPLPVFSMAIHSRT